MIPGDSRSCVDLVRTLEVMKGRRAGGLFWTD
jgi:hypothetical protein